MQNDKFYGIKPIEIKKGMNFFVMHNGRKLYYIADEDSRMTSGWVCEVKVRDEINSPQDLKFNISVENNIFVSKLVSEWKRIF